MGCSALRISFAYSLWLMTVCMVTVCCYAYKMPVKTVLGFLGVATYSPLWMAKLFREQKDSGTCCLTPNWTPGSEHPSLRCPRRLASCTMKRNINITKVARAHSSVSVLVVPVPFFQCWWTLKGLPHSQGEEYIPILTRFYTKSDFWIFCFKMNWKHVISEYFSGFLLPKNKYLKLLYIYTPLHASNLGFRIIIHPSASF